MDGTTGRLPVAIRALAKRSLRTSHLDDISADETTSPEIHVDARLAKMLGGDVRTEQATGLAKAVHGTREVALNHLRDPHTIAPGRVNVRLSLGRANQAFGGHTAGIEALAAEKAILDQGDSGPGSDTLFDSGESRWGRRR